MEYDNIFHLVQKAGLKKIMVKRASWEKTFAVIEISIQIKAPQKRSILDGYKELYKIKVLYN